MTFTTTKSKTFTTAVLVLVCYCCTLLPTVYASPTGASSCEEGGAVGSTHLTNPITGTLETGSFEVLIGGTPLLFGGVNTVPVTSTLDVSVAPTTGRTFRGALVRIEGSSTTTVLTAGTNAQVSMLCDGITAVGITHFDNTDKTEFGGTVSVMEVGDYVVDVTVVVSNGGTLGSEYYYSRYTLTAADAAAAPTVAPVAAAVPTDAPVAGEVATDAPVAGEVSTDAPVAGEVSTDAPVGGATPTDVPVFIETDPPVTAPTKNGTTATSAPAAMMNETETDAPARSPVKAPAPVPVPAPTSASTVSVSTTSLIGCLSAVAALVLSML